MRNITFKRMICMLLAVVLTVTMLPATVLAAGTIENITLTQGKSSGAKNSVKIDVQEDKVVIGINKVGKSGTAKLYQFAANAYFAADKLTGISELISAEGNYICDYACGTELTVNMDRYQSDGTDNLYFKYYLIRDDQIVAGPYYATSVAAKRAKAAFPMDSIKGVTLEDEKTIDIAKDLGASNTVINMDLCTLIMANEDEKGNPIDYTGRSDVIPFESNGKTFYFNKSYVDFQQSLISPYSREGINVILVLIAWKKTCTSNYPAALRYLDVSANKQTMAFNTVNTLGMEYWIAAMEFMANQYSLSADKGLVNKFVVSNEIDLAKDWNLIQPSFDSNGKHQRLPLDTYMEEYARTFRLANLAVKKYNSEAKVLVSLSQGWAENLYDGCNQTGNSDRYNTYASKDILDWLNTHEKARGDYDWGLALHPYPVEFRSTVNPSKTDISQKGEPGKGSSITGDVDTTPWVTPSNLEIYQLYLEREASRYNGQVRSVSLTESGLRTYDIDVVGEEKYINSTYQQAASIASFYYRASMLSCIEEFAYFQPHDRDVSNMKIGLIELDGTRKPSYELWKYIDSKKTFEYSNQYLKYISSTAKTYRDLAAIVKSDFDWDKAWDEEKIFARGEVNRLAGSNRHDTALMVAKQMKQVLGVEKFDAVIIASGYNFADALAGSYLSNVKKAPILLSFGQPGKYAYLDDDNIEYIKSNLKPGGTVYLLGGENAVPARYDIELSEFNVNRLGGKDRFDTNLMILKEAGVTPGQEILVCTATDFADSLSASATGLPILLVFNQKGALYGDQPEYLTSLGGKNDFCIIGGTNAVGTKLEKALGQYGEVTRLAGNDRLETSVMVAQRYFPEATSAVVAYGWNYPDGLCGGSLAYAMKAPLLLTYSKPKYYAVAQNYTAHQDIRSGVVLGGEALVTKEAANAIF